MLPLRQSLASLCLPAVVPSGGGGGFSPSSIAGLRLWLKADAGVLNGSGVAAANGDVVATWQDQSGNGYNATATSGPVYHTARIGTMPALTFTRASSQNMNTAYSETLGDFTVFVVFNATSVGTSATQRLVDKSYSNGFWLGQSYTGSEWGGGVEESGNPYGIYVALTFGAAHALTSQRSGATHTIRGDGGAMTTSNTVSTVATSSANLVVGCQGSSNFFDGDIAEILIYNAALTGTQITNVEHYLGTKYGLGF